MVTFVEDSGSALRPKSPEIHAATASMKRDHHYRLVLADDHVLVRHWIRKVIGNDPELQVAGEVSDGLELLEFLKKCRPDMILLDISMPHLGGIEATRIIKENYPTIMVLILTMHKNKAYLEQALSAGRGRIPA